MVAATAGAGKTTAARHALRGGAAPYSWLDLGEPEREPTRLLTQLATALENNLSGSKNIHRALRSGMSYIDAAALLAASLPNEPHVIVLDNVEFLHGYDEAVQVLCTLSSGLPRHGRLLLIGRRSLPLRFRSPHGPSCVGWLTDADLALTLAEADTVLEQIGSAPPDVEDIVRSTGGWVTGVILKSLRDDAHVAGLAGEADPLHGYVTAEVLGQLDEQTREFMVVTSLLDEVTVQGARGLGLADAARVMALLTNVRLPVHWLADNASFCCYPAFRSVLREQFERYPDRERSRIVGRLAGSLVRDQRFAEAVEHFLSVGENEKARRAAERSIVGLVLSSELEVADRWLAYWGDVEQVSPEFAKAEMLLSVATDRYARGGAVCDRLINSSHGRRTLSKDPELVALSVWLYTHQGRADAVWDVVSLCRPGTEFDIVKYAVSCIRNEVPAPPSAPEMTGSVFDALLMRARYDLGDIGRILETDESNPWVAAATLPWRAGALLAAGRVAECNELIKDRGRQRDGGSWLADFVEPKLIAETGDVDLALARLEAGRRATVESGSTYRVIVSLLGEIEIRLQHRTGINKARQLLNAVANYEAGSSFAVLREQREMLAGLMHLIEGHDHDAVPLLRRAVESMVRGHRMLHVPSAAIYLAEALWRIGEPDEADAAALTALGGAAEQGTNHSLVRALTLFPEVAARRLDAESSSDSEWSRIARNLPIAVGVGHVNQGVQIHLQQFGRVGARINDVEVELGLRKAHELLAMLAAAGRSGLNRQLALTQLFETGTVKSRAAYLRQTTLRLRKAIPGVLEVTGGVIRLGQEFTITSEFDRVVSWERQAASERGPAKLATLIRAIEVLDQGEYMPGCNSEWAAERREVVQMMAIEMRAEAADAALKSGQLLHADSLADAVISLDPYRELMWQTKMRVASALGDADAVVRIYRDCESTMATIHARPTRTTAAMLENLRR